MSKTTTVAYVEPNQSMHWINPGYTQPCPSCGSCPTCGRGGYTGWHYPYQPYWYTTTYGNVANTTLSNTNESPKVMS